MARRPRRPDPREPIGVPQAGQDVVDQGKRRDLRSAAGELARHWDALQERVPAPVLRVLVTLPWLLRRMPVPFWVPLIFMLIGRIRKHRARRAAKVARRAGG